MIVEGVLGVNVPAQPAPSSQPLRGETIFCTFALPAPKKR
jgi:hypothetical protein